MLEEDENLKINKKQKKQLSAFSKKIEEIISEYKNRKKFGTPKSKEDNSQKVDLKQYNEFFENIEELKKESDGYKLKLKNDDKFIEITQKEDELKYLKKQFKEKKEEYQYLLQTNKKLDGFQNVLLNEEIDYYTKELKNIKMDINKLNEEYGKYYNNNKNNIDEKNIKNIEKEIFNLEKEYELIQKNIEFNRTFKKNMKPIYDENVEEELESEMKLAQNMIDNVEKQYLDKKRKKDKLEKEVNNLLNELSKYQNEAYLNNLKMKEIKRIEEQLKLNKIKEQKRINDLRKSEEIDKKNRTKRMQNLMAESFKKNFPFKNNYKLIEEETKSKKNLSNKPMLDIAKNKMKNSYSSMDIFNTKREELKKKREKEKQEFMSNLDKELKAYDQKKEETIQEIKSLRDDIEKSLESNKIYEDYFSKNKKQN